MICYNHSNITVKNDNAVSLAVKGQNTAVQTYTLTSGSVTINTDDFSAGDYQMQFYDSSDNVIGTDILTVKQNLKYAAATYDFRSQNKIALDAITAFMQGRATAQQRVVKVGDKEIQYSTFEELLQWKNYFEKEVRKEEGKISKVRHEKFYRG